MDRVRHRWAAEAHPDPVRPEAFVKTDFKQSLKHLYEPTAKDTVEEEVPPMNFLMIDRCV